MSRDANVVGHTWQYVNKDGGPDRRFNYNPRYDKCQYGNVSLRFPGGHAVNLMISSSVITDKLMQAMC